MKIFSGVNDAARAFACIMDKKFVLPWQSLQGNSIRNIHANKLSYSNCTNSSGILAVSLTQLAQNCCWNSEQIPVLIRLQIRQEFEAELKLILAHLNQGVQGVILG
jgi:hypothetical protein